ncbi:MAG: DMT family transporter [Cyanobacteria bacterium P01_H01_bin.121]
MTAFLAFQGEFAALAAALMWAIASVLYARLGVVLAPFWLNFAKGVIAIALIGATLLLRASLNPAGETVLSFTPWLSTNLLLLSGVIGIGFGDTCHFQALNRLGPRRALLLESLAPVLAALLAWIFLSETLSYLQVIGIILTVGGIAWVISERVPAPPTLQPSAAESGQNLVSHSRQHATSLSLAGISFGILAALGQAIGAILSRAALATTSVDPLWSTLLRLVAGLASLLIWLGFKSINNSGVTSRSTPRQTNDAQAQDQPQVLATKERPKLTWRLGLAILIPAFLGTYLGIWLQQIALKYAATGIAQTLISTSPIFVLPLVAWLGEKLSWRSLLGAILALVGIAILFQVQA